MLVAGAFALLATPAAADRDSLYRGPAPRPGPAVLYQPPARAPQLTNAGIWKAAPILISGATAYRRGEFLYQDFLYDDHGADGGMRDPGDPRAQHDTFSAPNGSYTYPTAPVYAGNAADLVELRAKPLRRETAFRVTLNTLRDPEVVAFTIALANGAAVHEFPHGAGVSGIADVFVTVHGTSGDIVDAASGKTLAVRPKVRVDRRRRQFELRVPHSAFRPRGETLMSAGVGLWDRAAGRYLVPRGAASEALPGGAGRLSDPPAFFNVAFRLHEPYPDVPDQTTTLPDPSWWRDRLQGNKLAEGSMSMFTVVVEFDKLRRGVTKETHVPRAGPLNRIMASRLGSGQGVDFSKPCADTIPAGCAGELRGNLVPYAIYVPPRRPASGRYGLTLLLHSLAANYNQFGDSNHQSQLGARGQGHIVITPSGRGPDGWYWDRAGADTFEVWADVARRYPLDPDLTSISGYSMGGYGTYMLAARWPDLFAKAQPTVGPGDAGIGSSGRATDTGPLVASLRQIPFLIWVGAADELVPLPTSQAHADRIDAANLRYEFDIFGTADHFTLAVNDNYKPAADFLGDARVDRNPARISYVVSPKADFRSIGLASDHAYWVSGLRLRDASGATPRGSVDVRSSGLAEQRFEIGATERGTGTLTGGTYPLLPYSRQSKAWRAFGKPDPLTDRVRIEARNIRALTIDVARAGLSCKPELQVETDGPIEIRLGGCPGPVRSFTH